MSIPNYDQRIEQWYKPENFEPYPDDRIEEVNAIGDEYDPTPPVVTTQDAKDYEEYCKKLKQARIAVGYATEDGRLDIEEALAMTSEEMINFYENEADYDPY